jgi:hypothetical protein
MLITFDISTSKFHKYSYNKYDILKQKNVNSFVIYYEYVTCVHATC